MTDLAHLDHELARLADGDRSVFSSVFGALSPIVQRFCRRRLGDGPDAADAAQIALEKIFARASDYDPSRPALPWALAITAWECTTVRTQRRRARTEPLPETELDAELEGADQALARQADRAALHEALAQLSPSDRATLEDAFFDSLGEDANRGPKDASFRKRKERALGRLRALWRGAFGNG